MIGKNWRPISLLCPAVEMLEKLLLPKILTHIPFQHGFRTKHSTCTVLSTITSDIVADFSIKKQTHRTVLVNGQIYSNTFHARYSRAPLTSTSEAGRPITTARKEAKGVRSHVRHPSHFQATLQQYRSKSATTQ